MPWSLTGWTLWWSHDETGPASLASTSAIRFCTRANLPLPALPAFLIRPGRHTQFPLVVGYVSRQLGPLTLKGLPFVDGGRHVGNDSAGCKDVGIKRPRGAKYRYLGVPVMGPMPGDPLTSPETRDP